MAITYYDSSLVGLILDKERKGEIILAFGIS